MYTSKKKDLGKHDSSQVFEGLLCGRKVRFVLCGELGGGFRESCAILTLGRISFNNWKISK